MNVSTLADFAARAAKIRECCKRSWSGADDEGRPVEIGQMLRGLEIGSLPPTLCRQLKTLLQAAKRVLERYPLKTHEDYRLLSPQDREELRRIYRKIPDLVPPRHRQP